MKLIIKIILVCMSINIYAGNMYINEMIRNSHNNQISLIGFENQNRNFQNFNLQIDGQFSKKIQDLIDFIGEKDNNKIINYLNSNYGREYSIYGKINLQFNLQDNVEFDISSFVMEYLSLENPVFAQVNSYFYQDIKFQLSKQWNYNFFKIKPKLTVGKLRINETILKVSDFVNKTVNTNITDGDLKFYSLLSLYSEVNIIYGDILIEATNLPISKKHFNIYNVNLGYRTPKLKTGISKHQIELKHSLLYESEYPASLSTRLIISNEIFNNFNYNFAIRKLGHSHEIKYNSKYINIAMSLEKGYTNEFKNIKFEKIGLSLSIHY